MPEAVEQRNDAPMVTAADIDAAFERDVERLKEKIDRLFSG